MSPTDIPTEIGRDARDNPVIAWLVPAFLLFGLYLTSFHNYLLFHTLAEIFSVVVAALIFLFSWNSRRIMANDSLLFLGIGYLFVGLIDLVHTLSYTGMPIFPGYGTNLPTQLWIAARFLEAFTLLGFPLFFQAKLRPTLALSAYGLVTALVLASVSVRVFPLCFVEGSGLTPFKLVSEYVISVLLLAAIAHLFRHRERFTRHVFRLLIGSIVLTVGAELAFTFYVSAYGFSNLVGHMLKLLAVYLIYRALIVTGLQEPHEVLYRELRKSEEKWRSLVEKSPEHIMLLGCDGTIQFINYTVPDLTVEQVLGTPVFDYVPEEFRQEMADCFRQVIESGQPGDYETDYHPAEGEVLHFETRVMPVFDSGKVVALLSTSRDITERKQVEKSLRTSEVRLAESNQILSGVLEHTHMLAAYLDRTFDFIWVNRAYAEAGGKEPSFFPGKNHFDLYPHEENQAIFQQVLDTGDPCFVAAKPFEYPDQPERGVTYWDWSLVPIKEASEVSGLVLTLLEVTEHKQTEETLRESEEKFHNLFATSADGIMVLDGESGAILDVNKACQTNYGYSREEFLELTLMDVSNGPKESRKSLGPAFGGALTNIPLRYHKRKDGSVFPIEVSVGRFSLKGKGVVFGVIRDISARTRAKEILLKQRYFLERAQEVGHFGSWELDLEKNELLWSEENYRIFGLPSGTELTYETFLGCVHPDDRDYVDREWKAACKGKPYDIEHRMLVDGKVKWVREKAELDFNQDGECCSGIGFTHDITNRKLAEAQVVSSLREKEVLLREIHHRVKNNMQVIVSLLRMHSRRIDDSRLELIFRDCQDRVNAMSLIHETLYQSNDLAQIDFDPYLNKLGRNLAQVHGASEKGIVMVVRPTKVALGMDQSVAVGMLVCELITNAFKHAFPDGNRGTVSVELSNVANEVVELIVCDDGMGLPPEIDIRNSPSLGLSLLYITVTEQLGGTLEVERDGGTRYVVRFRGKFFSDEGRR